MHLRAIDLLDFKKNTAQPSLGFLFYLSRIFSIHKKNGCTSTYVEHGAYNYGKGKLYL